MARKREKREAKVGLGDALEEARDEASALDQADGNLPDDERWKMLRFIVMMGTLGFIVMVCGSLVMYPDAVGFIVGIGYTAASVGFAVGRFVFRQDRDKHEAAMAKMAESVSRMEEMMTKGARSAIESAYKAADQERNLNAELATELEHERAARRSAQRELAEHIRDCGG